MPSTLSDAGFAATMRTVAEHLGGKKDSIHDRQRDAFHAELAVAGFQPIAIVSTKYLDALFAKLKFYRLYGLVSGGVGSSSLVAVLFNLMLPTVIFSAAELIILSLLTAGLTALVLVHASAAISAQWFFSRWLDRDVDLNIKDPVVWAVLVAVLATIIPAVWIGVVIASSGVWMTVFGIAGGIICSVVNIGLGIGNDLLVSRYDWYHTALEKCIRPIMRILPHTLLCRLLWPGRTDLIDGTHSINVKPTIPVSADFQQLVQKARPLSGRAFVALPAEAIGIDTDWITGCTVDPLLCVRSEDGLLTAIIAQEGEFPSEQEALRLAVQYGS